MLIVTPRGNRSGITSAMKLPDTYFFRWPWHAKALASVHIIETPFQPVHTQL